MEQDKLNKVGAPPFTSQMIRLISSMEHYTDLRHGGYVYIDHGAAELATRSDRVQRSGRAGLRNTPKRDLWTLYTLCLMYEAVTRVR